MMRLRRSGGGCRTLLRALLLSVLVPASVDAAVIAVERVEGAASLRRNGDLSTLRAGTALRGQDMVTSLGAEPILGIGRYGRLRLGSGAILGVNAVPASAYAEDLQTVLRLRQGYMRLVWKRPELVTPWPLVVQLGEFQLQLSSGDFHFESGQGQWRFCAAEGEAQLPSTIQALPLRAPACYTLTPGFRPLASGRSPRSFVQMSRESGIGILPPASTPLPRPSAVEIAAASVPVLRTSSPRPAKTKPAHERKRRVISARRTPGAAVGGPPSVEQGSGDWVLNICSSSTREDAERQRDTLRSAGFDPQLQPVEIGGQTWYRLRLASLPSRSRASQLAQEVRQKFGYPSPWISRS